MWPNVTAGDVFLVTFKTILLEQTCLSTFKYVVTQTGVAQTVDVASDAFVSTIDGANRLIARFKNCLPTDALLNEVWVQRCRPLRLQKIVYLFDEPGTFIEDVGTANIAGVITRKGIAARPASTSSLHVPIATGPTAIAGGVLQAALKGMLNALATEVVEDVSAGGTDIWSPCITPQFNDPGFQVTPIFKAFTQDTVRVMRRRTKGVGI